MLGDGGHRVGGERIASTIVVGRGADTHTCEPMSQDRVAVVEAAVDFEKELGAELRFECLYETSGSAAVRCVVTQPIQLRVGKNAMGKLRQAQDVWHAPACAAWMVRAGRDAFVDIDPIHADESIGRTAADEVELQRLRKEIRTETEMRSPARRHLVTTPGMCGDLAEKNRSLVSTILNATSSETSERGAGEWAATGERTHEEQDPAICTKNRLAAHLIEQVAREARSLHELRPDASSSSEFNEFLGHAIDRRLDRQSTVLLAILGHGWCRSGNSIAHRGRLVCILVFLLVWPWWACFLHESEKGTQIGLPAQGLIPSVSLHRTVRSALPLGVAATSIGISVRLSDVPTRRKRHAREGVAMATPALNGFPQS